MKSTKENNNTSFIKCQCHAHALEIERFYYDEVDQGFNLSIWKLGSFNGKLRWRERLRWIWNILKTGNLWADQVIISNDQARDLASFMMSNLPKK